VVFPPVLPTSPTDRSVLPLRDRVAVISGLAALTVVAWVYMLYDAWTMQQMDMATMWMPPTGTGAWSATDFFLVFVMWAVMMVAMMVPSVTPMVMMFAAINRQRRSRHQSHVPTVVFLVGYLVAWVGFSAVVTLLQWPLHAYSLLTPMMDNGSAVLGGIVLLVAGAYQWTPWKDACLHQCRTPLSFLMTEWREGITGALFMGIRHGVFCVGCCWALMLILFAVGVMNILWILLIAGFVLLEKIVPVKPARFRMASGLVFFLWGLGLLAGTLVAAH